MYPRVKLSTSQRKTTNLDNGCSHSTMEELHMLPVQNLREEDIVNIRENQERLTTDLATFLSLLCLLFIVGDKSEHDVLIIN